MVAMDEETSKLYLQNLEEFVFDEAKLVTYKWLSRELNLHVNLSKELLHTFLKRQKKIVHGTYLLSGLLKDEVTRKVLIVQEEDLETAKSQFKILSSEHVYGIQKIPKVTDLNSLYIIDRYKKDNSDFKSLYNTMSALHCNEAVERAADEIAKLRIEVKACASSTDIRASQGSKKTTPEADKNGAAASTSGKDLVTKTEHKKEFGIAAMFAAQGMRSVKQENTSEKIKPNTKQSASSKNCIVMFLNRNIEKPEEKSEAEVSVVCNEKGLQEELLGDKSTAAETEISVKGVKPEQAYKKEKVSSVEQSTCKGKRKSTDDPPSKKRRRILHLSDSEDSDDGIFGSEDEEAQNSPLLDPEPASLPLIETDEVVAPTPQGETKPGRKRERKLKVSTFMDEDGYVVTKRKYVVESCTDSEGEEEKKKKKMKTEQNNSEKVDDERNSPSSEPPAKKKCSQKVKQATLMNFFKKK